MKQAPVDISIIIPCYNEEHNLPAVVRVLQRSQEQFSGSAEIIVVDGGSSDGTLEVARSLSGIRVYCCEPSRAKQMNTGVHNAKGQVFYFVHADSRPPLCCLQQLWSVVGEGARIGGYSFEFDSSSRLLQFNSWFTRFNYISFRGGDQSMFTTRELFEQLGGFDEDWVIMEEYDFIKRAHEAQASYQLLCGKTLVSARKYDDRSWVRVQVANICAMTMWRLGKPSSSIRSVYARLLG